MAKPIRRVIGPGFQVAGAAKRIQEEKRAVSRRLKAKKDRMHGAK